MIEITIKNYLDEVLDVPVYLAKPRSQKPKSFVLLEKTSGGLKDKINSATLAIQSYGPTAYDAAALNDKVKKAILAFDEIGGVKLNSDYNFTDTLTKEHRYQAVFDFYY